MSDPVASYITATLSAYDNIVRNGLRDGDVLKKVTANFAEIKKFYCDCDLLIEPEHVAAYKASIFIHSFLCDYKLKKDSPTFLGDQRFQLALYDAKKGRTGQRAEPGPPKKSTPQKIPFLPPLTVVSPAPMGIPGPGPRTMGNSAQPGKIQRPLSKPSSVSPQLRTRHFSSVSTKHEGQAKLGTMEGIQCHKGKDWKEDRKVHKGFRDIEESASSSESESEREEPSRLRPIVLLDKMGKKAIKIKRRAAPFTPKVDTAYSDSDSSSGSAEMKTKKKRVEKPAEPTGELYDPPCSACRIAKRDCEKQRQGAACIGCRRSKQRCDYSRPKRRGPRSKVEVGSSDDHSDGHHGHTKGGSRQVGKDTTKAITKKLEDIEAKMSEVLDRVDKLTTLVDRLSDFLEVREQSTKTCVDNLKSPHRQSSYHAPSISKKEDLSPPVSPPPCPRSSAFPAPMHMSKPDDIIQGTFVNSQEALTADPIQFCPTPNKMTTSTIPPHPKSSVAVDEDQFMGRVSPEFPVFTPPPASSKLFSPSLSPKPKSPGNVHSRSNSFDLVLGTGRVPRLKSNFRIRTPRVGKRKPDDDATSGKDSKKQKV